MDGIQDDTKEIGGYAAKLYKLTVSLTALQRILIRHTRNGLVSRDQTALIDAAIAAGRAEAQLVRAELHRWRSGAENSLQTIAEILTVATAELESQLDDLAGALHKSRS